MSKDVDPNKDMRPEVEIILDFPVTLDGETHKTLTMRRPKVSDTLWAEKLKGGDFDKIVKTAARLCGVTPEVMAELDDVDMKKVDDQYASFRGDRAS